MAWRPDPREIERAREAVISAALQLVVAERTNAHRAWRDVLLTRELDAYAQAATGREIYRTKAGRILSDSELDALAEEAERGYDVAALRIGTDKAAELGRLLKEIRDIVSRTFPRTAEATDG